MAENAQTLTWKERAAAPVTGRADKKQGRVTDAEGEQSVLALALRRPKPETAREAGTWRNLDSSAGRRESALALPCSPRPVIIWASTWQCSINEARGNGGKVARPNRGFCSGPGMIQGNRDFSGGSISRFLAAALVLPVV